MCAPGHPSLLRGTKLHLEGGTCGARCGAPSASTLRDGGLLDCLCHAYVMLSEVSQMASLFRAPGGKKCVHLNAGFEM